MSEPSRVALHVAAAHLGLEGLREMNPWGQIIHIAYAGAQSVCALALAVDRLADALTTEEKP